jgi:hypothetical protein
MITDAGDGGPQDAAADHAMDASPQPTAHDAAPEAMPPPTTGHACASAGYKCSVEVAAQCPLGTYPAPPGTQDCSSGQLCCKS